MRRCPAGLLLAQGSRQRVTTQVWLSLRRNLNSAERLAEARPVPRQGRLRRRLRRPRIRRSQCLQSHRDHRCQDGRRHCPFVARPALISDEPRARHLRRHVSDLESRPYFCSRPDGATGRRRPALMLCLGLRTRASPAFALSRWTTRSGLARAPSSFEAEAAIEYARRSPLLAADVSEERWCSSNAGTRSALWPAPARRGEADAASLRSALRRHYRV